MNASKVLIIVLGAILVILLVFSLQTYSQKQTIAEQYLGLQQKIDGDKARLNSQIKSIERERDQLKEKMLNINKELNDISLQRDHWKGQYNIAVKEKDALLEKLKTRPTQVAQQPISVQQPVQQQQVQQPQQQTILREDAYWASVVRDKEALEIKLQNLKNELNQQLVKFGSVKKSQSDASLELSKVQQQKDELERKLKFSEQLVNNISMELVAEKNDKKLLSDEFSKVKTENNSLRRQVKELASAKLSLEEGLQELETQKVKLQKRISSTESIVKSRMNDLLRLKEDLDIVYQGKMPDSAGEFSTVELPPIVVRAQPIQVGDIPDASIEQQPMVEQELVGKIISVNRESNFAIIDLGEDAGVTLGRIFKVYRGNKPVAALEVIQTRKDISAVDIKNEAEPIQSGDTVR